MDAFRTELNVPPAPFRIDHHTPVLAIGSCFAEEMGGRMLHLKFPVQLNPMGILYNPISLSNCLHRLLHPLPYTHADLVEHDGLWHSFDHHGSFSHPDPAQALKRINAALERAAEFVRRSRLLILTLGTAHVFRLKSSGRVVANCHKMPGERFVRERLEVETVVSTLENVFQSLFELIPDFKVVATVSPVRYLRDGLVDSNLSKATLLLAIDRLRRRFPGVHYFPAYELLIDDLRDYRFYATDMCHPAKLAIDYIWEHFQKTYCTAETIELCRKIESLYRAMEHRPLHPDSEAHRRFLLQQAEKCRQLAHAHPELDFSDEVKFFEQRLHSARE